MKIIDLNDPNREVLPTPCGLVLGNFDGVHLGHTALIEKLKETNSCRENKLALGAFCFEQHPSHYFGNPIPLLCSNEEKLELLRRAGLQFVILGDFSELKDMSPEEFVSDFLVDACQCRVAVCGFNYSFGAKGIGSPQTLEELFASEKGREVVVVPQVTVDGKAVSSTAIRALLENGQIEDASRLLGRPIEA